jgi:hypothetical protein
MQNFEISKNLAFKTNFMSCIKIFKEKINKLFRSKLHQSETSELRTLKRLASGLSLIHYLAVFRWKLILA